MRGSTLVALVALIAAVLSSTAAAAMPLSDATKLTSFLASHRTDSKKHDVVAATPDVCELATQLDYACQTLTAFTDDGFALMVNYLPAASGSNVSRGPVILQHGLTDCSFTWMMQADAHLNLAMMLVDRGFSVFLPNSRGNMFSMNSTAFGVDPRHNDSYWKAQDMDLMAQYDVPAVIQLALNVTGMSQTAYVGHSQGGMQGFAAFSTLHPELASVVRVFVGVAPAVFVNGTTSKAFHDAAKDHAFTALKDLGIRNIATTDKALRDVGVACTLLGDTCWKGLDAIFGYGNRSNVNPARWETITTFDPAGTSIYNMIHWQQFANHGQFQMHDYGAVENQARYGRATPPRYHLERMSGPPTVIFHGGADALVSPSDVARLVASLPSGVLQAVHLIDNYGHMDFVWGLDAATRFYPKLIAVLEG